MANKHFKVGLYNAGSLGTNHDNIVAAVNRNTIDVLAVNETWIHAGQEGRAPTIFGYRFQHTPRPREHRSRGGGVGFYIRQGITVRSWRHPVDPAHATVEQMWLIVNANGRKLIVGTAYRPEWVPMELFFDALTDTVSSIPECDSMILTGDFNINYTDHQKCKQLKSFLSCFNLDQLVSEPTHFTNGSQTMIDLVCSDLTAKQVTVDAVGTLYGHRLVVCEFHIKRAKVIPRITSYRPIKNISVDNFNNDLQHIRWDLIAQHTDVNVMLRDFNYCMLWLFDTYAPIKTVGSLQSNETPNLQVTPGAKSEGKKQYYQSLKSAVSKALVQEKKAYFKFNINNKLHDPKTLWKNLKSNLLPKTFGELLSFFNDPDLINNHFINVPGTSQNSHSYITYFETHKYTDAVFIINNINLENLITILKQLKSNAEGYDSITLDMIFMTLPYTLDTILAIINSSIETTTFPDVWKHAIVRPIPKINNPRELKDFRPTDVELMGVPIERVYEAKNLGLHMDSP
ncbi:uncharacterized protein LOC121729105 [Aricia agestis]|uniref:uncharacterized protein LOC121729105 n=1 Tax=Aricia agestis TaxID=91739 RepID=UPI001C2071AB|nr:uncharacterized protein LOC121729105 [Aricia agestis]